MLTLHKKEGSVFITEIVKGRKRTPVYWYPTIDESLMNSVEDLDGFNNGHFRDRFELSREQAASIFSSLTQDEVLEQNQSKFFKVKRHVTQSLLSEMDIRDQSGEFEINFDPDPDVFSGHMLYVGSTSSGKTYTASRMCLRNLEGPVKSRRHFLIVSSEWDSDKTLAPLKQDKYSEFVDGIDVSASSFKESQWNTKEEFFENEIRMRIENMRRGGVILCDDLMDCVVPNMVRRLINRGLRTFRHLGLTLQVILHSLRSGAWSAQLYNSCKYICMFPRTQRAKIVNFLNRDVGLTLPESRETARAFAQSGRYFYLRLFAPELMCGPNLLKLL